MQANMNAQQYSKTNAAAAAASYLSEIVNTDVAPVAVRTAQGVFEILNTSKILTPLVHNIDGAYFSDASLAITSLGIIDDIYQLQFFLWTLTEGGQDVARINYVETSIRDPMVLQELVEAVHKGFYFARVIDMDSTWTPKPFVNSGVLPANAKNANGQPSVKRQWLPHIQTPAWWSQDELTPSLQHRRVDNLHHIVTPESTEYANTLKTTAIIAAFVLEHPRECMAIVNLMNQSNYGEGMASWSNSQFQPGFDTRQNTIMSPFGRGPDSNVYPPIDWTNARLPSDQLPQLQLPQGGAKKATTKPKAAAAPKKKTTTKPKTTTKTTKKKSPQ
jgi:hypothetical protein